MAPFFVVGAAITYADLVFNRSRGVASFDYSLIERASIASRSFWFYVGKLFWPFDLTGIYPHWNVRAVDPAAWAAFGVAVVLVAALWLLRRRIGRGPLAGLLFFAVTLSPVLGFVDFNYMLFSFVADRYQYLASIGITTVVVAAATAGLAIILRRKDEQRGKVAGVVLMVLVLAGLGTLSGRHASLYADGVRFFTHVVSYHPTARDAHLNLGSELLSRNRLDEALDAYRIAEEQRPGDCKPPYGGGLALYHLGRFEEAEDAYERALDRCPRLRQGPHGLRRVADPPATLRRCCTTRGHCDRGRVAQRECVGSPEPGVAASGQRRRSAGEHRPGAADRTGQYTRTGTSIPTWRPADQASPMQLK